MNYQTITVNGACRVTMDGEGGLYVNGFAFSPGPERKGLCACGPVWEVGRTRGLAGERIRHFDAGNGVKLRHITHKGRSWWDVLTMPAEVATT
jgi:hypothetical protein